MTILELRNHIKYLTNKKESLINYFNKVMKDENSDKSNIEDTINEILNISQHIINAEHSLNTSLHGLSVEYGSTKTNLASLINIINIYKDKMEFYDNIINVYPKYKFSEFMKKRDKLFDEFFKIVSKISNIEATIDIDAKSEKEEVV